MNLSPRYRDVYWSADTLFCRCQLTITWMSNIKDVRWKPQLGISWSMAAILRDVVVVFGRTRPRFMPLSMLTMKKELHGFLFPCMHVFLFLYLWCSAWRAFGPSELRYLYLFCCEHKYVKCGAVYIFREVENLQ